MEANPRPQPKQPELDPMNRAVAALLAIVWLLGGLGAVCLGLARQQWLIAIMGPLAIGYGLLWVKVAWTGRRLRWPARRR